MSNRSKLEKFAANLAFPNVFENMDFDEPKLRKGLNQYVDFRNKWKEEYFKNNSPLILELACGRGEYSLGMARMLPERNYVGVDIKGARIWKGASTALNEQLNQIVFVRTKIELLDKFFGEGEVDEIWITFADPFPRPSKSNKRLTSDYYLDLYHKILKPGALLHLKTDDPGLYDFSVDRMQSHPAFTLIYHEDDIYSKPLVTPELELKTYYERMHLQVGKKIKYIRAKHS